ncbi:hypothetical protein E2C01_051509 [Portunus trituberculatus]|uniref:Uncharacterized protein n=1 Tax=Portunus trituberculatus TaxID=210409 RepID=A0A5B7GJ37_PORTR|nr:hypothetical protein [Portunus trituberculatus]
MQKQTKARYILHLHILHIQVKGQNTAGYLARRGSHEILKQILGHTRSHSSFLTPGAQRTPPLTHESLHPVSSAIRLGNLGATTILRPS